MRKRNSLFRALLNWATKSNASKRFSKSVRQLQTALYQVERDYPLCDEQLLKTITRKVTFLINALGKDNVLSERLRKIQSKNHWFIKHIDQDARYEIENAYGGFPLSVDDY